MEVAGLTTVECNIMLPVRKKVILLVIYGHAPHIDYLSPVWYSISTNHVSNLYVNILQASQSWMPVVLSLSFHFIEPAMHHF